MAHKTVRPISPDQQRARKATELRVARISDEHAWDDLHDKVRLLWGINPPVPGGEGLRELAAQPLRNPGLVDGELHRQAGMTAVLFAVPDSSVWALYSLGSARKGDPTLDGENAFTHLLVSILAELRPDTVTVPEFDRLIRSIEHISPVWRALVAHTSQVRSAAEVITMSESHAEIRFMTAVMAASVAAASTNQHRFSGQVQALLDGKTLMGPQSIPTGYRRRDDHRVEPDESQRAALTAIITSMAAGLDDADIVAEAAAAGGSSPMLRAKHGPDATFLDHRNPAELVATWYANLELWRTGIREQALKVTVPGVTEYQGVPVQRDADGHDYLVITQDWGLPEGGWATDELFEAALASRARRAGRRRPTGGSKHKRRRPLAGLVDFVEDRPDGGVDHYRLFPDQVGRYQLRRRHLDHPDEAARSWGRRPHLDGEALTTIYTQALHQSLADGIIAAIRDGVPITLLEGRRVWREQHRWRISDDASPAVALRRQLDRATKQRDNLTDSIAEATSPTLRKTWQQRADELQSDIDALQAQLDGLDTEPSPPAPDRFGSELGFLAACLAVLAKTDNVADADVGEALATILDRITIRPDGPNQVAWHAHVNVLADGGVARAVASGTTSTEQPRRIRSVAAWRTHMLADYMTEPLTLDELARRYDKTSTELVRKALIAELHGHGLHANARTILLFYSTPTARQTIWASLHQQPWPDDIDPRYGDALTAAYLDDPPNRGLTGPARTEPRMQAFLDYLTAHGGSAPRAQLLAATGLRKADLTNALTERPATSGERTAARRPRSLRAHPDDRDRIALIDCLHCTGWASIASRLPETPEGLLCPDCHRMPAADSPTYPNDYITRWQRPR